MKSAPEEESPDWQWTRLPAPPLAVLIMVMTDDPRFARVNLPASAQINFIDL